MRGKEGPLQCPGPPEDEDEAFPIHSLPKPTHLEVADEEIPSLLADEAFGPERVEEETSWENEL